jgi:hypothetical protein
VTCVCCTKIVAGYRSPKKTVFIKITKHKITKYSHAWFYTHKRTLLLQVYTCMCTQHYLPVHTFSVCQRFPGRCAPLPFAHFNHVVFVFVCLWQPVLLLLLDLIF